MVRRSNLPDEQQALVLDALHRAAGKPVSFAELRAAGVELPASIVSELELAGIAIERCRSAGGASVRLPQVDPRPVDPRPVDPRPEVAAAPEPDPPPPPVREPQRTPPHEPQPPTADDWTSIRRYRASSRDGLLLAVVGSKRVLAPVALLVAIVAVAVIIIAGTGGAGGNQSPTHVAQKPRSKPPATTPKTATHTATATTTATTSTTSTTAPPPTPVSLTLATQLESEGHDLLTSGQYGKAVPVLRRALAATGEHVSACVDPASEMCLTYAFALYDLGHALRMSGNPAAAVPILERRLQIDNQRPAVLAELELARHGATGVS